MTVKPPMTTKTSRPARDIAAPAKTARRRRAKTPGLPEGKTLRNAPAPGASPPRSEAEAARRREEERKAQARLFAEKLRSKHGALFRHLSWRDLLCWPPCETAFDLCPAAMGMPDRCPPGMVCPRTKPKPASRDE